MQFILNKASAIAADQKSAYITETGKYIGIFTLAEGYTAISGAGFVALTFKSRDGQEATIRLCVTDKQGNPTFSMKTLNAIMAVLRQREIKTELIHADKYNPETRQKEKMQVAAFTGLMNKPIGVLIQMEEFEKVDSNRNPTGETGWKPDLFGVFDAETELTASEILLQVTKPEHLAKMVLALKDKPLKKRPAATPIPSNQPNQNTYNRPATFDDFEDDIPF